MLFGYPDKIVDKQYGLYQLREVSFQFAPSVLRRVAAFLDSAADAIEKNTFRSSHIHIDSLDDCWSTDCPNCDLIVLHPQGVWAWRQESAERREEPSRHHSHCHGAAS